MRREGQRASAKYDDVAPPAANAPTIHVPDVEARLADGCEREREREREQTGSRGVGEHDQSIEESSRERWQDER